MDLQRWKPRRPSPELRERIFRLPPREVAASFDFRDVTRWIVPACGCFLLVLATLSNHLPHRYAVQLAATNLVIPPLMEESGPVVMPVSSGHSGVNAVPAKKLEWNFGARPAATGIGAFLISYTNKLIR